MLNRHKRLKNQNYSKYYVEAKQIANVRTRPLSVFVTVIGIRHGPESAHIVLVGYVQNYNLNTKDLDRQQLI